MTKYSKLVWVALLALALFTADSDIRGQRRGGGAAVGARGGAVVGPYGGSASGAQSRATVVGPGGGSASRAAGSGSVTTPGGSTIKYGGAGKTATGPGGVTAGRGVGGVQVTTPGGQTATKVGRAGGVAGPGGNAVGGRSSVGVASGPGGVAVGGSRGGVARGPGGVVAGGSRVGAAAGPGGAVVGGAHVGAAAGPYGLSRYAAGGRVAVGHQTRFVAAGTLHTQGAYIRRSFVHYNCFTPTWYAAHRNAWRVAAWTTATFWVGATWAAIATTCALPPQPVIYDYGTTIVYEGDQVYYNGEPVATAAEYTQQAIQLAAVGEAAKAPETDEWTPLGVFGMVQGDEKDANDIFQLAINKDGTIRGNYYNALTDTTLPVYGSLDKKTQRAAWTVGERKDTVYETGIGNLTQDETAMLVHFGKERTQQWTLVRLEKPDEQK